MKTQPDSPTTSALDPETMRSNAAQAARLMRALSNPHRLLILCVLSEGELSVSELNTRIDLSQSALSQHLAVLRQEQLVLTRRESQTIFYSVVPGPALEIVQLLHDRFCCPAATASSSPVSTATTEPATTPGGVTP